MYTIEYENKRCLSITEKQHECAKNPYDFGEEQSLMTFYLLAAIKLCIS